MLGGVYAKNNKIDKAISNYKKAIRLNPKIKRPHSELGNIYEKLKDYKNAIKYYKNAIKINSEDDKILFKLGNNYNYENNLEEAIENYQKAIKLNPNNEYYYLMLSTSYLTLEKFRESKIAVKKALKINSNNANTYLHLGLLHFNLKEYNSAIIAFNNSKKISSEDDSVIENLLSKAYIKTNNYKKAILTIYKTISLYINESNNKIEGLSSCFIDILKYDKNLTIEKCLQLEDNIIKDFKNLKELQIPLILIQTFRKVVLENKPEALYELPKEQREFFNEKIIAFRKTL